MPDGKSDDKTLFIAARQIEGEADRRDYLERACAGDASQFNRVWALLQALEQNARFLETPALNLLHTGGAAYVDSAADMLERPGTQIGPYRICEPLGEGGMGMVYVAEQEQPVRRQVALKIIKPGMDSKEVLARFGAERQALALMSHANIAKILDGGTTQAGRPFFVMELVNGLAITDYCDAQQLGIRARLKLFITVCQAVQHAHLKGIIHRDLKPSNILVELHDAIGVPKVIDFGIAKATGSQLTQQTAYTQNSQLVGTPLYMSPEQAGVSGLDVDTRSDVYSLGVVLYELLAGVTPFEQDTLKNAGIDEWRRILREDDPKRPSSRFSGLTNDRRLEISDRRKMRPGELLPSIHRELDWIVMKTLEKDRERRFESATALAQDIQRYLNDEPVESFPPSATYRLQKFARRNKTTLLASFLVAVALIVGSTISLWQAHEANVARNLLDIQLATAIQLRKQAEHATQLAKLNEEYSRQLVYAADIKLAAQAWETGDVRRFTNLLDRHSPTLGQPDRRGFEWFFLHQFGKADYRTVASATRGSCVARFSADGRHLVTGRDDGAVCFWDGQSYQNLATVPGHQGLVRGIDFTPDGSRIASIGDDGMVQVWDVAKRRPIHSFQAHSGHGFRVFFVQQGKVLATCGEDPAVRLWDASTGAALGELEGYSRRLERAAMDRSPDGSLCVSSDEVGKAYVWDVATGKRICLLDPVFEANVFFIACCARFSPDGKMVAVAGARNSIRICNAQTGAQLTNFFGHEDDIQAIAFHPSGKLLASCDKAGVIRTWPIDLENDAAAQAAEGTDDWPSYFQGHASRAWSLDFSPDGSRLVSASKDGTVRSWSGRKQKRKLIEETDLHHNVMGFVPDTHELLVTGSENSRSWNAQSDVLRTLFEFEDEPAFCLAVLPDGQNVATGQQSGTIHIRDLATGKIKNSWLAHSERVDRIVSSADGGLLASGSWDGAAKLWDATGRQLGVFEMPPHCEDVALSPDGRWLACATQSEASLYDVASQKRIHHLLGHQNTVSCIAFSPDGKRLATGSHDRTIRIWNVESGELMYVIAAQRSAIKSLAFSSNGLTIASGSENGTVAFSHVQTGQFLFDQVVGDRALHWLQFSPDDTILAAAVIRTGIVLIHAPNDDAPQSN